MSARRKPYSKEDKRMYGHQRAYYKEWNKAHESGGYKTNPYHRTYKSGNQSRRPIQERVKSNAKSKNSSGWMSALGSGVGSAAGAMLGGPVGMGIGSALGGAAGSLISYITGYGDYKIKKNVFAKGAPPRIINNDVRGGVIVRNREYICDIISSASANTFNLEAFSLNPGLVTTFPLLSEIAQGFDQYEFQGLAFEFRTMSGNALTSTNTALGTVCMATSYNAASPVFTNKSQVENYEYGQSVAPSSSCLHMVECARSQMVLDNQYVRTGNVPSGQDIRFYDHGVFQIATSGLQGTDVNVGELWVTYQCKFMRPKLFSALGLAVKYGHYYTFTGLSNTQALGDLNSIIQGSNNSLRYTSSAANTVALAVVELQNNLADVYVQPTQINFARLSFPQRFLVYWSFVGSGAVAYDDPTITFINCTVVPTFANSAGSFGTSFNRAPNTAATAVTSVSLMGVVNIPAAVGASQYSTISFGGDGLLPTTPTAMNLYITQIPNDATN